MLTDEFLKWENCNMTMTLTCVKASTKYKFIPERVARKKNSWMTFFIGLRNKKLINGAKTQLFVKKKNDEELVLRSWEYLKNRLIKMYNRKIVLHVSHVMRTTALNGESGKKQLRHGVKRRLNNRRFMKYRHAMDGHETRWSSFAKS